MEDGKSCFQSHNLLTGVIELGAERGKHLESHTQKSEMQIGKTLYIIHSRYTGKETFADQIRRLILRTWEEDQHRGK